MYLSVDVPYRLPGARTPSQARGVDWSELQVISSDGEADGASASSPRAQQTASLTQPDTGRLLPKEQPQQPSKAQSKPHLRARHRQLVAGQRPGAEAPHSHQYWPGEQHHGEQALQYGMTDLEGCGQEEGVVEARAGMEGGPP
jgi:hypothetical protein